MQSQALLPGMKQAYELTSAQIRRFVRVRLLGFEERQKERNERRAQKRERRKEPIVKCPIVFRAVFRQPKGGLNPSGLKMAAPVEVELYRCRIDPPEWRARSLPSRIDFRAISGQREFRTLEEQIELHFFAEKLTPWQVFDSIAKRALEPDEWAIDPHGKPYVTPMYRENEKARAAARKEGGSGKCIPMPGQTR